MKLRGSHRTTLPPLRALTALLVWAVLLSGCATSRHDSPPTAPPIVSPGTLDAPKDPLAKAYLGLGTNVTQFTFHDVPTELVVVDLFDMYCHSCHTAARHVLELYHEVQRRGLNHRIKFIGLGVGNTPLETEMYRDKFALPFPVFPDRRAATSKSLGPLRVPSLIVLRRANGNHETIHRTDGVPRQTGELLEHILRDADHLQPQDTRDALHHDSSVCDEQKPECAAPERSVGSLPKTDDFKTP